MCRPSASDSGEWRFVIFKKLKVFHTRIVREQKEAEETLAEWPILFPASGISKLAERVRMVPVSLALFPVTPEFTFTRPYVET